MSEADLAMVTGNLLGDLPDARREERFQDLVCWTGCRLERIVSFGQATPAGQWLEQDRDEWVAVLAGAARLAFADGAVLAMGPGDHVLIRAGRRHRVEWTRPRVPTVWLALHVSIPPGSTAP